MINELQTTQGGLLLEPGKSAKLILELEECNDWEFDGTTASGVYDMVRENVQCNYTRQDFTQEFVIKGDRGVEGARGLFYLKR